MLILGKRSEYGLRASSSALTEFAQLETNFVRIFGTEVRDPQARSLKQAIDTNPQRSEVLDRLIQISHSEADAGNVTWATQRYFSLERGVCG